MTPKEKRLHAVIAGVRTCFNQLKSLAESLHQDLGVNASMRAVMETLANGGRTVPDIAKGKGVSRQHIQTIVDALRDEGLVVVLDNPAHRRSPLFELTPKGRKTFSKILARETAPLATIAAGISVETLDEMERGLSQLTSRLVAEIAKGAKHGKAS